MHVIYKNCSYYQGRNQKGGNRAISPPRNFHERMYLLGTATSYIIFPPENISWLRPCLLLSHKTLYNNNKTIRASVLKILVFIFSIVWWLDVFRFENCENHTKTDLDVTCIYYFDKFSSITAGLTWTNAPAIHAFTAHSVSHLLSIRTSVPAVLVTLENDAISVSDDLTNLFLSNQITFRYDFK